MNFSKVIMSYGRMPEIAKVNRKTGALWLNTKIWNQLPAEQKDFVLFHEDGHLRLQTADEFEANQYAVSKFTPAGKFNNEQLGKRIVVMRDILAKADGDYSGFSFIDEAAGATSGIIQSLSVLGIGSKGRATEAEAQAELIKAQAQAGAVNSKNTLKIILITGVLILVGVTIYLTLRKK